ncbi:hypothetical protein C8P68_104312 [Mucilaginibacter yixingensis]|uniref:Lipoprotein n=1 Tax=Mucilaginibacter yixingensis TaxID=1295612 RepID=A0A2T5J9S9_9SPHI|nr:hypothetical protein [Mucilaginibacter yixingensis]PTQ96822.1 hypothetical protein C8P68_104312 [Mucilaginibacter yixingensis]
MNTLIKTCAVAFALSFVLVGCSKKAASIKIYSVTENDAASMIANNLLPQYGGLANQFNNCSILSNTSTKNCGIAKDTTFNGVSATNAAVTYKYGIVWHYTNNCQGTITSTLDGKLTYEGSNYTGDGLLTASVQVAPNTKAPLLNLTGTMALSGMQRVKGQADAAFNTVINFNNLNLTVDGVSKKINSGTTDVTVTCTNGTASFNFKGNIQFSAYNKAKITLDSGTAYPISW